MATTSRSRAFEALRHRDFRLLFVGQAVSLLGDAARPGCRASLLRARSSRWERRSPFACPRPSWHARGSARSIDVSPVYWKPRYPTRSMRERAWARRSAARERELARLRRPSLVGRVLRRLGLRIGHWRRSGRGGRADCGMRCTRSCRTDGGSTLPAPPARCA